MPQTKAVRKKTPSRVSHRRLAASKPLSKSHEKLLKLVARSIIRLEPLIDRVKTAEHKALEAKKRITDAMKGARAKETAATKQAVIKAKASAKKAHSALSTFRTKLQEEDKALKTAVGVAEAERKKGEAKHKAIAAFTIRWERDYDRRMAQKMRSKGRKKRTAKKAVHKTETRQSTAPATAT